MLIKMKDISVFLIFFILLSACRSVPSNHGTLNTVSSEPTLTLQPTFTQEPALTTTPTLKVPDKQDLVCSPIEGETLNELPEIITQSFNMPRPGQDDGHHGVDFAFYRRKNLLSIDGVGVLSALDGEVVTVINDRYPYGNAVIVETSLDSLSQIFLDKIIVPAIQPTVMPDPKFFWEPEEFPFQLSETERSVYILYAHLKFPPAFQVGDKVTCGEPIGFVGNTGDSSNPHLHFETRVGPSGARFKSMAYYITQSTETERYNYVVWRTTNFFQLFDPMRLLSVIN